ncbi:MAG: hypothetical protein EAX96_02650 [Candidatus Lokiarchaeota archaeon]|nr:hypothetical protein [Candidatus Lokiarchaeota archaeon]
MIEFLKVLKEDLEGYYEGLSNQKYDFCNVMCNRMNTNAVILESKEFIFLSVILKDLTSIIDRIIDPDEQIKITNELINHLKDYLKDENIPDLGSILKLSDFFRKLISKLLYEEEKYTGNLNFTDLTIKYYLEFLVDEITNNNIIISVSAILPGVTDELQRVFKTHGLRNKHFILKYILEYSTRVFDYQRYSYYYSSKNEKNIALKDIKKLFELIKKNITTFFDSEENKYINDSLDDLFYLCKEWRFNYTRFLEISPVMKKKKKELELPEDMKEKMREIVSKGMEKELDEEV